MFWFQIATFLQISALLPENVEPIVSNMDSV